LTLDPEDRSIGQENIQDEPKLQPISPARPEWIFPEARYSHSGAIPIGQSHFFGSGNRDQQNFTASKNNSRFGSFCKLGFPRFFFPEKPGSCWRNIRAAARVEPMAVGDGANFFRFWRAPGGAQPSISGPFSREKLV
jgi:hypothetical protein